MRVFISLMLGLVSVFGLLLLSPDAPADSKPNGKKGNKNDDPNWNELQQVRKRQLLTQLRGQFNTFDTNDDGKLDPEELAKALRGKDAKPVSESDDNPGKARYPDVQFLSQNDANMDGSISRTEFDKWADDKATIQASQIIEAEKAEHRVRELQQQALKEQVQAQRQKIELMLKMERERLEKLRRMNDKDKKNDKNDKNDKKKGKN